jgi:hypothetical protein
VQHLYISGEIVELVSYHRVMIYDALTCTQRALDNTPTTLIDLLPSVLLHVRYEVELTGTGGSTDGRVPCPVCALVRLCIVRVVYHCLLRRARFGTIDIIVRSALC